MKLYHIIFILGLGLGISGFLITVRYYDCRSDLSIGGRECVPFISLFDLAQASEIAGAVCVLISLGLFYQSKK